MPATRTLLATNLLLLPLTAQDVTPLRAAYQEMRQPPQFQLYDLENDPQYHPILQQHQQWLPGTQAPPASDMRRN